MPDKPKNYNGLSEDQQDWVDETLASALGADAVLHIRYAAKLTEDQKAQIADWLNERAADLRSTGHTYAVMFTASYNPEDGS